MGQIEPQLSKIETGDKAAGEEGRVCVSYTLSLIILTEMIDMMKLPNTSMLFVALIMTFSGVIFANPDVAFKDSAVVLKHELKGKTVKFLLSEYVPGYELPDEYFDVKLLVRYVDEKHVFPSDHLKLDFLRMLRSSIETPFTFAEFMTELKKVLAGFQQWNPNEDGGGGCSSTNIPSAMLLFVASLSLCMWRRCHLKNSES